VSIPRFLLYGVLLGAFPADAMAWGLQTHVYFSQGILFALPLLDPALRRSVQRFPRLLLAGACLPDLALLGRPLGTLVFRGTHGWSTLRRFSAAATCDEDRAIVCGYASHLLADIVAHNYFVPEHERRIADVPHVTHALSEWAMDEYVKGQAMATPSEVLVSERSCLADYVTRATGSPLALATRALGILAGADRTLRTSGLPRLCRGVSRLFDSALAPRFDSYVRETSLRLRDISRLLDGAEPAWEAEPAAPGAAARLRVNARRAVLPARFV